MIIYHIIRCIHLVILVSLWTTTEQQASVWHYSFPNDGPAFLSFFDSASRNRPFHEYSVFPDSRERDQPLPFYGPQNIKECDMNRQLTSKRNIASTRRQIDKCNMQQSQTSFCYFAYSSKYRNIDGSCNNLEHPYWGKSFSCLQRILPYDYADGKSYPRRSCTGDFLPNSRHVSNVFHQDRRPKFNHFTTHFMEWGQVLAHDLSLNDIFRTSESGGNTPIQCCNPNPVVNDQCSAVAVPPNDPFYPKFGVTCITIARTETCSSCAGGPRIHLNRNTAYHDLSLVYGSTEEEAKRLRSGELGMLDVTFYKNAGPLPPVVPVEDLCVSAPRKRSCYRTGDPRTNQNLFLLTHHTILLRYHNHLCQELHLINPHWDDEKLYQEARRIAIAQAQMITYSLYLPHVLGVFMDKEGLTVAPGKYYTEYKPHLDPTIDDEYTTVAARYGHTLIPNFMSEVDAYTGDKRSIRFRDQYFTPFRFAKGQLDLINQGMMVDLEMKHDVFVGDDVRNFLYRRLYMNETSGNDLVAISITRGREHGIPGYTYYLEHFFNFTVKSFEDLKNLLPDKSIDLLQELFESVHDIDLYSAGFAEYYVDGGFVGPTFAAILAQQYRRLKYGDRYWFEHKNQPGSFTPEQLAEIKRTTFSRIICETTDTEAIQENVFLPPSARNPVVPCKTIPRLHLALWKE